MLRIATIVLFTLATVASAEARGAGTIMVAEVIPAATAGPISAGSVARIEAATTSAHTAVTAGTSSAN